jgi:hypothetical protein
MTTTARPYKNCQSCGMPMHRDEKGGGTSADDSRSVMYCSLCYEAGRFKLPDISAEEMQRKVKGKLQESGFPSLAAWFFTRRIPRLTRWNTK